MNRWLSPKLRKLVLLTHVCASVAWLGVAMVMCVLGATLRQSSDDNLIRGGYGAMRVIDDLIILPVGLITLVSGLLLGLGTKWGVVRYRWVLTKLAVTLGLMANGFFFLHGWTVQAADMTADASVRVLLVIFNGAVIALLVAAAALSIYKPWGRTRWGRRRWGARA